MSAKDLPTTCDRRILKAFYTQYVAVLLIMLVFTIGAFQRGQSAGPATSVAEQRVAESLPFGSITLIGEITDPYHRKNVLGQLDAVVAVVREHDVRAVVKVPLIRTTESSGEGEQVENAVGQLTAIEDFFKESGLPAESVRLTLVSQEKQSQSTVVEFEEDRHGEYPL